MNCLKARFIYDFIYDIYIYIHVYIGNTIIYTYHYINMKVKWLAAVNSLEPGGCFQKVDVIMIYLANFISISLLKLTWYRVIFG